MSRRALAFILGLSWCLGACEFRDAPNTPLASAHRTDLTFKWADDAGAKEVKRSFISINGELGSAAKVTVGVVPKTLNVLGVAGGRDCVANIWVRGESNVRLDCIAIEGRNEVTLRGLDLALQDGVDGIHPVRIETDSLNSDSSGAPHAVNFSIRTLPRSLDFTRAEVSGRSFEIGATAGFHQVAELKLNRAVVGDLSLQWPTKLQASLRRRLTRHDYDFDFFRCTISQRSTDASETIPLEVLIIEHSEPIRVEWPKLFSLETQSAKIGSSEHKSLSLFAKHPYLDKVFSPAPYKETASVVRIEKECSPDRAVFRVPSPVELLIGSPIPRSTHAFIRMGTDEEDPVLEFDLQGLEVADLESASIDEKPIRRALLSQRFEIVLSKGGSR